MRAASEVTKSEGVYRTLKSVNEQPLMRVALGMLDERLSDIEVIHVHLRMNEVPRSVYEDACRSPV